MTVKQVLKTQSTKQAFNKSSKWVLYFPIATSHFLREPFHLFQDSFNLVHNVDAIHLTSVLEKYRKKKENKEKKKGKGSEASRYKKDTTKQGHQGHAKRAQNRWLAGRVNLNIVQMKSGGKWREERRGRSEESTSILVFERLRRAT